MANKLKAGPKIVILLVFALAMFQGVRYGLNAGLIPMPAVFKSKVITASTALEQNDDPTAISIASNTPKLELPSAQEVSVSGPEVRFEEWFWNAQLACNLANGGPRPTKGSLTAKYGVNLTIRRNDDTPKMQENLAALATALAGGDAQPQAGVHFVGIMGDQAAGFLGPLNARLAKLGPEYTAEVVYTCGRSKGEDQFMGPAAWKSNPKSAIGGVVSVVVPEGDFNIVAKWTKENDVPLNPDVTTYDPDALNLLHPGTYVEAATKYVQGYTETRPVVRNGRRTTEKKTIGINAVSTWTPADVTVAMEKGGLVRIVSTKEYSGQMPHVLIGIKKWNQDNRQTVVNLIRAFGEAGDQALAYSDAQQRGAEASYAIVQEQSPEWILKYYKGTTERDKTGVQVELGGSRVHNIADNLRWFGLSGGSNKFAATYTLFADILHELYPAMLPEYPPASTILNTSYLEEAAKLSKVTTAEEAVFRGGAIRDITSNQRVYVQFKTGSAVLLPEAERQLETVYQNLVVAGDLAITLTGHTDNTGTPDGNQALSEARAFAVKKWLQGRSTTDFPSNRFADVAGRGQDEPIASNTSEAGRAQNRRVEIQLGRQ